VYNAMSKTVADDKLPMLVRNAAADSLGQLNYASANGINALETVTRWGSTPSDACDDALEAAKKPNTTVRAAACCSIFTAVLSALGSGEDAKPKRSRVAVTEASQQALVAKLRKIIEDSRDSLDNKPDESRT